MELNNKNNDNDIKLNSLIKIFFITFFVSLVSAIAYFVIHVSQSPLKPSEIGQVGDFYGGLLNPFLTFLIVLVKYYCVKVLK